MTLGVEVMGMERTFLPCISGCKNTSVQVVLSRSLTLPGVLGSCSPDHSQFVSIQILHMCNSTLFSLF